MTKYLVVCLLLAITDASVHGSGSGWPQIAAHLVKVGLVLDGSGASRDDSTSDESQSCARVSFSRNLRYGETTLTSDVATRDVKKCRRAPCCSWLEKAAGDLERPMSRARSGSGDVFLLRATERIGGAAYRPAPEARGPLAPKMSRRRSLYPSKY
jgi:hypothetical protein